MFARKVLFDGTTDFGHYKVVETVYNGRRARLLYGGHNTPQSGMALDDTPELLFDYNQRFLEVAQSIQPKRVLVIGGGAFTLPKALLEKFPAVQIDAVEIDPLLPELAHRLFDVPYDRRLHVIVADGRHFLETADAPYDLIIVDAFSEFTIPRPLYSVEATAHYARLLKKDGVFAMNFIAAYKGNKKTLAHELVATFCQQFTAVSMWPADHTYATPYDQNLLLIASHHADVALDYVHSHTVELEFTPPDAIVYDEKITESS